MITCKGSLHVFTEKTFGATSSCDCGLRRNDALPGRARPRLTGVKRHYPTLRNYYHGDGSDFTCVKCGKETADRVHRVPRGWWENLLNVLGLLRE